MGFISKVQSWFRRSEVEDYDVSTFETDGAQFLPKVDRRRDDDIGLPQFRGTASDLGARAQDSEVDQMRLKLRNAFTPSQPVSDVRKFAGRNSILRTLIRSIEDQQLHVVLFGERGIGKTSLLHVLADLSRRARYIVRYTSCGEGSDFSETFRAIAADIPLLYHADFDPTSDEIEKGGSLADMFPAGPLSVAQVSEVFSKVANTRVLIILDEFDRSDSAHFRRLVAELIKNLSDRSIRVQLVIAGVASNLTELIAHIPSIRRNIIGLPVPAMEGNEVQELVRIGEAVSGLKFDAAALETIVKVANGSPYLASLVSQHAGLSATERESKLVEVADVQTAVEQTLYEVRLRVSPVSLHHIEQANRGPLRKTLNQLAHAAISNSGRIDASMVPKATADGSNSDSKLLSNLIEAIPDDPTESFRFKEEGAALYLWILSVSDQIAVRK